MYSTGLLSDTLRSLLHLQPTRKSVVLHGWSCGTEIDIPQQRSLWTAHGLRIVALTLVKGVAAFVECIDLGLSGPIVLSCWFNLYLLLAFAFIVVVLLDAFLRSRQ